MLAGATLLALSLLGEFTELGDYGSVPARAWELFDGNLSERTPSYASLLKAATANSHGSTDPAKLMQSMFDLVSLRFNFNAAHHNVFSNWLLWGMGLVHPAISHIRDPEVMVSRGHSLFCGQASYLLVRMALDSGIIARHVGLNGHVVMEAVYDGGWHLYDPDMEVVPLAADGRVLGLDELVRAPHLLERNYAGPKAVVIPYLRSIEDNTFMSYPQGSWFVWKSEVLFRFEQLAAYLKYVLPLVLLLMGFWWRRPV